MATSVEFKDFVLDQLQSIDTNFSFSARKMFGEYCIYLHEHGEKKVLFLLCDEQVFIKKYSALQGILENISEPFKGAKEWFVLDIDNLELLENVIKIAKPLLESPKNKSLKNLK